MTMYALGVIPLIECLSSDSVRQIWYADDATACGSLMMLQFVLFRGLEFP